MAPTPSPEELTADDRCALLKVASRSVAHGVAAGQALTVDAENFGAMLRVETACFVTLRIAQALRGCVGSLSAQRPLVCEVARAAYMAAFRDPRFSPLTAGELPQTRVHISVLSRPVVFPVSCERELLERLSPGVDGLVLQDGPHMGTFLPDVWSSIPDPASFVAQLKLKAGLDADHWSDRMVVKRYTTQSFE